jgi:non-ribosomal peptide synthetase component F
MDHPRPSTRTYRGGRTSFAIGGGELEALRRLARAQGVTMPMLLLAAYQTLLSRYTGQDDIVLGTPIANRRHTETESLIGFFINTLVLRTDLSGDPTFMELLGRVRTASLEAYDNQDVPLEKLVDALAPVRDLARPPLFHPRS